MSDLSSGNLPDQSREELTSEYTLYHQRLPELRALLNRRRADDQRPAAYLRAVQTCPDVVERESDPLRFLRITAGNVEAAARRIWAYWDCRLSLFGGSQAFRTLATTGDGALTTSEVRLVKSGRVVLPIGRDAAGCRVLLCHEERTLNDKTEEMEEDAKIAAFDSDEMDDAKNSTVVLRVLFYWLQLTLEMDDEYQTEGLVYLRVVRDDIHLQERIDTCWTHHSVLTVFPIKIKAEHFCLVQRPPRMELESMEQLVQTFLQDKTADDVSARHFTVHFGDAIEHILPKLITIGFLREYLPIALGGKGLVDKDVYLPFAPERSVRKRKLQTDDDPDMIPSPDESSLAPLFCDDNDYARKRPVLVSNQITMCAPLSGEAKGQKLQELKGALDAMPAAETKALMTAWQLAPSVVETESDPSRYLHFTKYNAVAAARRLAEYWKHRLALFGPDRYLLRMNCSGRGTLSGDDVTTLNSEFVAPIVDGTAHVLVLRFDKFRSTIQKSVNTEDARLRCIFYVLSTISQHDAALSHGWTCLHVLSANFNLNLNQNIRVPDDIFPMHLNSLHVACMPPGAVSAFREAFMPAISASLPTHLKNRTFFHIESLSSEILLQLQKYGGLSKTAVPAKLGGEWTRKKFKAWKQQRVELENMADSKSSKAEASDQGADDETGAVSRTSSPDESSLASQYGGLSANAVPAKSGGEPSREAFAVCQQERDELESMEESKGNQTEPSDQGADDETGAVSAKSADALQVEIAMESLPMFSRVEYERANHRVPDLVKKESNPVHFLIREGLDASAAARRLAAYWEKRVSLFGARAYLPLNQTGEGALCRADMALLSSGFMVLLPENETGHAVMCYDGTRLWKSAKDCQLRVAFYLFSLLAENKKSQSDGVVVLHLVDKLATISRDTKRQNLEGLVDVFPIHLKEVHAISHVTLRGSQRALMFASEKLFGNNSSGAVVVYDGHAAGLAERLRRKGISRLGTPKAVGGSWGYENFVKWQELRTRYEWDLPPGTGVGNEEGLYIFDFSNVKRLCQLTEDEKIERKRKMNVLHSRRKRERERIEIEVLQEQCMEYEQKNKELFEDNLRMENLAFVAMEKIACQEQSKSVADRPTGGEAASLVALSPAPWALSSVRTHVGNVAARIASTSGLQSPFNPSSAAHPTGACGEHNFETLLLRKMQEERTELQNHALQELWRQHDIETRRLRSSVPLELACPHLGLFQDSAPSYLHQPTVLQHLLSRQQPAIPAAHNQFVLSAAQLDYAMAFEALRRSHGGL
jgi:hypothetical protein